MRGSFAILSFGVVMAVACTPVSAKAEGIDWGAVDLQDWLLPPAYAFPSEPLESESQIQAPMLSADRSMGAMFSATPYPDATGLASGQGEIAEREQGGEGNASIGRSSAAPVAFMAIPDTDGMSVTTDSVFGAEHGLSASYLKEDWQKVGFVGGLTVLAAALFWRLGLRARDRRQELGSHGDAADEGDSSSMSGGARYETLQEAIRAMRRHTDKS